MSCTAADCQRWEIPGVATFAGTAGGLVRLRLSTPLCTAEVYLQGAHVTHFQPAGSEPLLFLSAASHFAPGVPIRGGVPVIFPWFGARTGRPDSPAHGFARTLPWGIEALSADERGVVTLVLRLESDENTRAHWPFDFIARHRVVFSNALEMQLEIENTSAGPFTFEEALHTYLAVGDVRQIRLSGLAEVEYLDKVDELRRKKQAGEPIRITGETDRVYLHTRSDCLLEDPVLARRLTIAKAGSDTTVIWNPWIAKAQAMADFHDGEWPRMMCVETANTGESALNLAPGGRHIMKATVAATASVIN